MRTPAIPSSSVPTAPSPNRQTFYQWIYSIESLAISFTNDRVIAAELLLRRTRVCCYIYYVHVHFDVTYATSSFSVLTEVEQYHHIPPRILT